MKLKLHLIEILSKYWITRMHQIRRYVLVIRFLWLRLVMYKIVGTSSICYLNMSCSLLLSLIDILLLSGDWKYTFGRKNCGFFCAVQSGLSRLKAECVFSCLGPSPAALLCTLSKVLSRCYQRQFSRPQRCSLAGFQRALGSLSSTWRLSVSADNRLFCGHLW